MNLQTITIDLDTHAVVPREATDEMTAALCLQVVATSKWCIFGLKRGLVAAIAAAPKFESAKYPPPPKCVGKPCLNRGPECEDDERCEEEPAHE